MAVNKAGGFRPVTVSALVIMGIGDVIPAVFMPKRVTKHGVAKQINGVCLSGTEQLLTERALAAGAVVLVHPAQNLDNDPIHVRLMGFIKFASVQPAGSQLLHSGCNGIIGLLLGAVQHRHVRFLPFPFLSLQERIRKVIIDNVGLAPVGIVVHQGAFIFLVGRREIIHFVQPFHRCSGANAVNQLIQIQICKAGTAWLDVSVSHLGTPGKIAAQFLIVEQVIGGVVAVRNILSLIIILIKLQKLGLIQKQAAPVLVHTGSPFLQGTCRLQGCGKLFFGGLFPGKNRFVRIVRVRLNQVPQIYPKIIFVHSSRLPGAFFLLSY